MADHHDVELTPVQRRRLKSSAQIQQDSTSHIAYQHTVLCQTALPYRDPGSKTRVWERRQGAVTLALEAGRVRDPKSLEFVEVGLPYGSRPRLILAHLNRQALLSGSPTIEVEDSLTAFIRRILNRRAPDGREIRRFKNQLTRFAAALVRLAYDASSERAFQVDTKIITAFELWSRTRDGQRVLWPSEVRLSQEYFESLTRHAVPLDERAIAALSNSPMALDVYAWLAQRLHRVPAGKPQKISWQSLYEQFGHGYRHIRQFRADFLKVLELVHAQYPAANIDADKTGLALHNSPPPVAASLVPVRKALG